MKRKKLKLLIKKHKQEWIATCQTLLDCYNNFLNYFPCPFCKVAKSICKKEEPIVCLFGDYCKYCVWYFFTGYDCANYMKAKKFTNVELSKEQLLGFVAYLRNSRNKRWVRLRKKQLSKWIEKLKKL